LTRGAHETRPIGAAQILYSDLVSYVHARVVSRDGRIVDLDLVIGTAPDSHDAAGGQRKQLRLLAYVDHQLIGWKGGGRGLSQELWHGYWRKRRSEGRLHETRKGV
jgi:hypothetical protein